MNTDIYLDFNAGLLWYALFADNQSLYFGGAIQHLNTPNISFLENVDEKWEPWKSEKTCFCCFKIITKQEPRS